MRANHSSSFFRHYLLNPADFACFQPDLYAMMVRGGFCQNILHPARRESTCWLIFFQHYENLHPRLQVGAISSVHNYHLARIRKTTALPERFFLAISKAEPNIGFWIPAFAGMTV